jgi:hypothetical protein
MTPYERAKAKRAQEREADDLRYMDNMFLYLEACWGPLDEYVYDGQEVSRADFLARGHALCLGEIRTHQRRDRALRQQQRAQRQRDAAGGEP